MRLLTKADACRALGVSLSTLDRRIGTGELETRREPHGRRHRVYVLLDDATNEDAGEAPPQGVALAVAQERIRSLEEQVDFLRAQLALEQQRSVGLKEVGWRERGDRNRMRRVVILGLAITGLLGILAFSVLVWWSVVR